jgi:hypothetical protein
MLIELIVAALSTCSIITTVFTFYYNSYGIAYICSYFWFLTIVAIVDIINQNIPLNQDFLEL